MSLYAAEAADALQLAALPDGDEWRGTWHGHAFGLVESRESLVSSVVRLYCVHERSLRLGLAMRAHPSWDPRSDPHATSALQFDDARLERFSVRAAEPELARTLSEGSTSLLAALALHGPMTVDDHRLWLTPVSSLRGAQVRALASDMAQLSLRFVSARESLEARFERAMAPVWSVIASRHTLTWHAEESRITGDLQHGATLEARVDSDPGRLFTEIYVEWPSLERGLSVERRERRGIPGDPAPALHASAESIAHGFARAFSGAEDAALAIGAQRAALAIASYGASLVVDDTGLVARVDHVIDDADELETLLGGAVVIARSRFVGGAGLYR